MTARRFISLRMREGYDSNPHSCSHAVWYVIKQYVPNQPYLVANTPIHRINASSTWREVQVYELSRLASEGILVVGGLAENPNGHVVVVYPGPEKFCGGYFYKGTNGKIEKAPPDGTYALAMSASMGSWPGAKSRGDKTVFDPWGRKKFAKVRFWKYVGD